jgi:hypothetical protein
MQAPSGFLCWDAATGDGTAYWSAGTEALTGSDGLFDFMLGSTTPLSSSVFDHLADQYAHCSPDARTMSDPCKANRRYRSSASCWDARDRAFVKLKQ